MNARRGTRSSNSRQNRRAARRERRRADRKNAKTRPHQPRRESRTLTRQDALGILALGLLLVGSYFPAFFAGFVWDDRVFTEARAVRDIDGLWRIYFSPAEIENEAHYWPLVYTTFWLEHKLWGYAPTGYHIVNVLLHLINTLLLWRLVARLTVPGAWIVAAVFAVHPLHVESVAWVIERKDLLSALFYLAAFSAYIRFVAERRPGRYFLALFLFALGMLCKSIAVTLPAALLIYHWWQHGRMTGADLLRLMPFFAVGLIAAVADVAFSISREPLALGYSMAERVLIATHALWFYAGKLLWPANLAVIYPHWEVNVADPLAWGYVITAFAGVAALYRFRHRIGRGPLAGALFFAVTLSPVLGFVDFGYMQFSFVADRYQYLAGIGVMAVLVGAADAQCGPLAEGMAKGGSMRRGGNTDRPGNSNLAAGGHLQRWCNLFQSHHCTQPHGARSPSQSGRGIDQAEALGRSPRRLSHRLKTGPERRPRTLQRRGRADQARPDRRGRGAPESRSGTRSPLCVRPSKSGRATGHATTLRRSTRSLSPPRRSQSPQSECPPRRWHCAVLLGQTRRVAQCFGASVDP